MPEWKPRDEARDLSTPPAGAPMCFPCVVAICGHRRCDGVIPALTYFEGTALCQDCAAPAAISRWRLLAPR